jgi:peptidoglycan/LPS O-acetylase OafA/YrhL
MRDLPNLDFVRSVAVITVVVEHTLLALGVNTLGPYRVQYMGVLGVLVFFVLTALVLMWSLERKPHTLDFYIRRWFRIYPLALAVIAIAFLFHTPTQRFFVAAHPPLKELLLQASLMRMSGAELVGVMWSLQYEVEMYILLPVLFFFVRKNFAIWPLLGMLALVISTTHGVPGDQHNFAVAIGYFLPGIMAYVGFGRWQPRLPGWLLPVFLVLAWLVGWYHFTFHRAWFFCLIIGLALPLFRQMQSEWVLAPSRQIAKYSYGVYLTHPFAIVLGLYLLRGHILAVRLLVEVVPLFVLPVVAYHLLEHPMIRLGSRLAARAETKYEQRETNQLREEPALR